MKTLVICYLFLTVLTFLSEPALTDPQLKQIQSDTDNEVACMIEQQEAFVQDANRDLQNKTERFNIIYNSARFKINNFTSPTTFQQHDCTREAETVSGD